MKSRIIDWWDRMCRGGLMPGMDGTDRRYVYMLNVYWVVSVIAYTFFLLLLLVLQPGNEAKLLLSNFFMYLLFFAVRWLVLKGRPFAARHLLILAINGGIFFYDVLTGFGGWVFVFYIPFLFVAISLFTYRAKPVLLGAYVLLSALLFLAGRIFLHKVFAVHDPQVPMMPWFSITNFLMALLLVVVFAANIIRGNFNNLQQIERSRLNLQAMIDNTTDSVWSLDSNSFITSANKVFKRHMKELFGVDIRPGFDMKTIYERPDFPALFREHHRTLFETGTLHDVYKYFGNRHYEVFGTTYLDAQGMLSGASFHVRDITGIKRSSDDLQQAFINLQTLIDNTHASIWSVDTRYHVIAANRIYKEDMRRIFGVDVHSGFDVSTLFTMPGYPAEWLVHYDRVFAGETFQLEYSFEGDTWELMVSPILGLYSSIVGAAFYARSITKRKQNEQALLEAKEKAEEASRVKAQFLSNISHELRTPLNGIIAITRIMLGEPHSAEELKRLEVLKYSGDHMLSLIDNVLDFNKMEAGKMVLEKTVFNLHHAMEDLAKTFTPQADEKNIHFEVNLAPEINQQLTGDITRLNQVMNNLLGNAFKFTAAGKVSFAAAAERQGPDGLHVRFTVSDTGIGIAPDKIDSIFESFTQADVKTTRKYGGTGLGLTISKKLVELMQGSLTVQSEPGAGTTFTILLHFGLAQHAADERKEKGIAELQKFTGIRVLLAEDNPINLLVASTILEKWEMEVTQAEDGQKALEAMQRSEFDLVLMDLEMPVLDGINAVREIRRTNSDVPVIAFTAAIYENMQEDLLAKGMNGFVPKPFKPEQLHRCITAVLGRG